MLACANCQNFLHGSRLSALGCKILAPGGRRKKPPPKRTNWDFTVSHKSAALIREQTPSPRRPRRALVPVRVLGPLGIAAGAVAGTLAFTSATAPKPISMDEVVAAQKAWGDALVGISQTYLNVGDYAAAIADLDEAIDLAPARSQTYYASRALAHRRRKDYQNATSDYAIAQTLPRVRSDSDSAKTWASPAMLASRG